MEAVIDTNALVYDYVEDSHFHHEAREALDGLDRWIVPSVVLEEFVFVMKKAELEDRLLKGKINELLKDGRIIFEPLSAADVKNAIELISSEKTSFLRFNDKLILSVVSRRNAPLLTFDKELGEQCRRLGARFIP
jgi:predicted nucleic acid-binding protein